MTRRNSSPSRLVEPKMVVRSCAVSADGASRTTLNFAVAVRPPEQKVPGIWGYPDAKKKDRRKSKVTFLPGVVRKVILEVLANNRLYIEMDYLAYMRKVLGWPVILTLL